MSDVATYNNQLSDALEAKKNWLDSDLMPRLKDEFRLFQGAFSGLYKLLLKKSIIHEDIYQHEMKVGDIAIPPEGPFPESDKIDQISIRLSQYEVQLDFLINFYAFTVESFQMEKLKIVLGLVKYFHWIGLSANSKNINTKVLMELLTVLKNGNDQLSISIAADCTMRLEKGSRTILKQLKELSDFHRESYKLETRLRVMDYLDFDPATVITHKDETMRQIKRKFAEAMADRPFYPELIDEILHEDYSGEGPRIKRILLENLGKNAESPKVVIETKNFNVTLLEGIRALGTLSFTLSDIHRKITQNSQLLESAKNTFMDKLRRLVLQMMNKETSQIFYDIEFFDPTTASSKIEELDFYQFAIELDRKSRFLSSIANRASNTNRKLEHADDKLLIDILGKNIEEIQALHRTLNALDLFFKSEAKRDDRDRIFGIKPELTSVKNALLKANQKRHEYISRKEELDQMERLGIKAD